MVLGRFVDRFLKRREEKAMREYFEAKEARQREYDENLKKRLVDKTNLENAKYEELERFLEITDNVELFKSAIDEYDRRGGWLYDFTMRFISGDVRLRKNHAARLYLAEVLKQRLEHDSNENKEHSYRLIPIIDFILDNNIPIRHDSNIANRIVSLALEILNPIRRHNFIYHRRLGFPPDSIPKRIFSLLGRFVDNLESLDAKINIIRRIFYYWKERNYALRPGEVPKILFRYFLTILPHDDICRDDTPPCYMIRVLVSEMRAEDIYDLVCTTPNQDEKVMESVAWALFQSRENPEVENARDKIIMEGEGKWATRAAEIALCYFIPKTDSFVKEETDSLVNEVRTHIFYGLLVSTVNGKYFERVVNKVITKSNDPELRSLAILSLLYWRSFWRKKLTDKDISLLRNAYLTSNDKRVIDMCFEVLSQNLKFEELAELIRNSGLQRYGRPLEIFADIALNSEEFNNLPDVSDFLVVMFRYFSKNKDDDNKASNDNERSGDNKENNDNERRLNMVWEKMHELFDRLNPLALGTIIQFSNDTAFVRRAVNKLMQDYPSENPENPEELKRINFTRYRIISHLSYIYDRDFKNIKNDRDFKNIKEDVAKFLKNLWKIGQFEHIENCQKALAIIKDYLPSDTEENRRLIRVVKEELVRQKQRYL